MVNVQLIQCFLYKQVNLSPEILLDRLEFLWEQQMFKLADQVIGLARVEGGFHVRVVQACNLEVHFEESVVFRLVANFDVE